MKQSNILLLFFCVLSGSSILFASDSTTTTQTQPQNQSVEQQFSKTYPTDLKTDNNLKTVFPPVDPAFFLLELVKDLKIELRYKQTLIDAGNCIIDHQNTVIEEYKSKEFEYSFLHLWNRHPIAVSLTILSACAMYLQIAQCLFSKIKEKVNKPQKPQAHAKTVCNMNCLEENKADNFADDADLAELIENL